MSGPSLALDERERLADWCLTLPGLRWFRTLLLTQRDLHDEALREGQDLVATIERGITDGEPVPDDLHEAWEMLKKAFEDIAQFDFEDRDGGDILAAIAARGQRIRQADVYWVSPDMVRLTDAAYSSRPQEPLRTDVVPPAGFVWLAEPTTLPGFEHGAVMSAFAWHRDSFIDSAGRQRAGIRLVYWMPYDTLHRILTANLDPGESIKSEAREVLGGHVPFAEFWEFGQSSPSTPCSDTAIEHAAQWAHAFWVLSSQSLVTTEPTRPERGARRRAERAGLPTTLNVVTLRRTRNDHEIGAGGRDWSHRWVVRGFWRQQWYPSEGTHRARWIDDYIKGPQDRPLLVKDRVFAWRR